MDLIMNLGANIDMDKLPKVLLEAGILLTAPASGRSSSLDGLNTAKPTTLSVCLRTSICSSDQSTT